ncbi:MAG: dihydropteroate synthase [Thermodesulfobacteriota bacterium]
MKPYVIRVKGRPYPLGERTVVMGIVNVTPDSFSDGGLYHSPEAAFARAMKLVEEGADILDIGGESTRPFSDPVCAQEETDRVVPVIERILRETDVPVSIDTSKAEVARAALAAGAAIVNDVTALSGDPQMAETVREAGCPVVLMHMLGRPKTMQTAPSYDDVTVDVIAFLKQAADRAVAAGIERAQVLADPGIGFGKTAVHNLVLVKNLARLEAELDLPVLLGASRKSFIRKVLSHTPGKEKVGEEDVLRASDTVSAVAAFSGVHVIRVHDVARTRAALAVAEALRICEGLAPDRFEPRPGSGC